MLKQLKTKDQKGFTIIEVLIVLAIAGLIMVIVFLAVPALQRSQRNQSRKTDVNNLLSSVSDFTGNNGGTPPATQTDIDTVVSNVKLGYYKDNSGTPKTVFYGGTPTAAVSASTTAKAVDVNSTEEVNIYVGKVCTSPTGTATATGANSRNVALVYVLEQASGNGILQCTSS